MQAADVFTTTPQILTDHLVSLADPKSNFAAQNVVPLVYRKGVNATIVNTLNAISARLTTAGLLEMDKAIIVDHANYPSGRHRLAQGGGPALLIRLPPGRASSAGRAGKASARRAAPRTGNQASGTPH